MNRLNTLNRVDRQLWQRFWAIAKPFWGSEEKTGAIVLLIILIALRLAISGMSVSRSYLDGDMMTAISKSQIQNFYVTALMYIGVLILSTPIHAGRRYVEEKLGLYWRRWLTYRFLNQYFRDRAYYELNHNEEIDNPDQRICEDIKSFTKGSLAFLMILVGELIDLIAFIGILWSISVPLVIVVIVYAACGTIITGWIGQKLIGLNYNQLKREADFRYSLVHVRDHAESIAFYGGEEEESEKVRDRFNQAFKNFSRVINWQRNLELITTGYNYIDNILPAMVIAPMYFEGLVEFGIIIQAVKAFRQVLNSLSVMINNLDQLSAFAAGVNRLSTFEEALLASEKERRKNTTVIDTVIDDQIALSHMTLSTPKGEKTLVRDVSVAVQAGEGLLIMGPSGCGKSSLLRAIAGLWNCGTGRLQRPQLQEMLFLPQRPYMVLGSLRQQLLYPHSDRPIDNDQLDQVLEMVNLADLPERVGGFEAVLEWDDILSLGEQQRLAFARLLLTAPRYAILDESTSALDIKNEQRLYQHLRQQKTTLISVGHRPSLLSFHQHVLELDGHSKWRLIPAQDYVP